MDDLGSTPLAWDRSCSYSAIRESSIFDGKAPSYEMVPEANFAGNNGGDPIEFVIRDGMNMLAIDVPQAPHMTAKHDCLMCHRCW